MALKKKSVKASGKAPAKPAAKAEAKVQTEEKPQAEPEKKADAVAETKTEVAAGETKTEVAAGTKTSGKEARLAKRQERKKLARKLAQEEKKTPKPAVSDAMREEATKKAIEIIKKGLTEDPKRQKKGFPYTPVQWATEFKDILGSYMKFVERCKDFVVIQGDRPGRYTVHLQGDAVDLPEAERLKPKKEWELKLRNSWQIYLQTTPKAERNPDEFVQAASKLVQIVDSVTGPATPPAGAEKEEIAEEKVDKAGAEAKSAASPKRKAPRTDLPPKKKQKKA